MVNKLAAFCLLLAVQTPQFPLDQELTSSFSGACNVEITCKVVKTDNVYTYMYSIKNKGTKPIKVKWDMLSRAAHFGNLIDVLIDLEPDENVVFTLQHPDPPTQTHEKATAFFLTTDEKMEKLVKATPDLPKELKIKISKKSFYASEAGSGYGALPKSWVFPFGK